MPTVVLTRTFLAADASVGALAEAADGGGGDLWPDAADGAAAVFDSAAEALRAAAALQRAWRARDAAEPAPRLAIHTDLAGPDVGDGHPAGPGVTRCRRLLEVAAAGQLLVSAAAAAAVGPDLPPGTSLEDLGVHRLRDLSPPLRLYALRDEDDAEPAPPPRSLDTTPNNLPSRPTSFVGRATELAELRVRLGGTRLLTIVGPGGSGKTRLAAQLAAAEAERWSDGVWWVELGHFDEPAQVAQGVAEILGLLVDPGLGALASLSAQLADRSILLCLDNCEHLLGAAAEVADTLSGTCPGVSVLLTSREPLGLAAERLWRLEPLPREDARELFLDRAMGVEPQLAVGALASAEIESMCSRLDGSPLAVELAAAWLPTLTPREIDAGLDDRFALLVRSPRDAVPRHSSLLASMAWSHDLLDPEDRVVFRRLGIFPGDFDLAAARAVCGGDGTDADAVLPSLARLVDKSLVETRERDGGIRYRLLETIRQYAMDRLRAAGERPATADRLLEHMLATVRAVAPERDRDKDRWRTALAGDHESLRAAIVHGLDREDPGPARELVAELPWFWHLHRQGREGLELLHLAIARAPAESSALQARLLAGVALVADTADPLDVEVDAASRAAELARDHGEEALLSLCLELGAVGRLYTDLDGAWGESLEAERVAEPAGELFVLDAGRVLRGIVLHLRDEHDGARELLDEPSAGLLARGDRGVASTARAYLSGSALVTGALPAAVEQGERAIATAAPLADHLRVGMGRAALGLALGAAGDLDAGLAALEPVRSLVAAEEGAGFLPEVRRALGLLHLWAGEADAALAFLAAEAASMDSGQPTYLALRALPPLAAAQRAAGQIEEAARTAGQAVELARARSMPSVLADGLAELAALHAESDRERALQLHHEALTIRVDHGLSPGIIAGLEALARLGAGTAEQDARLLGAAATARDDLSMPPPSAERAALTARTAALRERLGDGFDAELQAGAALSLAEAAAYASRARGSRDRPEGGWESLTPTELEVVQLAAEGLSNPEIAARLFMSRSTVKTHLSHVYAKLNIANRTELAAVAAARLEDR